MLGCPFRRTLGLIQWKNGDFGQLGGRYRAIGRAWVGTRGAPDQFYQCTMGIGPGYNARACTWIGPYSVDTVFDTGATRNSIDHEFLSQLALDPAREACIQDICDFDEPLECSSMQQSSTFEITKAVKLRLTFREGAIQDSQEVQKCHLCGLQRQHRSLVAGKARP